MKTSINYAFLTDRFLESSDLHLTPVALYGYGAFTSIKYAPDGLLFLDKHLDRLKYNCRELNMPYPTDDKIVDAIKATLEKNNMLEMEVIVRVTLFPEYISWADPQKIKETPCAILVTTREMYHLPADFSLKTVHLERPLAHLKTTNYVVNMMAKAEAREHGYHDALFVNNHDNITEGTAWNIFFIKNNKVYTPSVEGGLLSGITRKAIFKVCQDNNIDLISDNIHKDSINDYAAAFTTNASQGPHCIYKIDDHVYDCHNSLLALIKKAYNLFPKTKLDDTIVKSF